MPRQRASIASAFRERKLPMEEKKELLDQDERVVEIELERLHGFVNNPFKVQADSQMIELFYLEISSHYMQYWVIFL